MKLYGIVLVIFLSIDSFSQKLEIQKDVFPVYQGIITADKKEPKQIYGLLKEWIAKNYTSSTGIIQLDDPENGKIIFKGVNKYTIEEVGPQSDNFYHHIITFEVKSERFRFTIEAAEVTYGDLNQPILSNILLSDPPKKADGTVFSGRGLKSIMKQKTQHLSQIKSMNEKTGISLKDIFINDAKEW